MRYRNSARFGNLNGLSKLLLFLKTLLILRVNYADSSKRTSLGHVEVNRVPTEVFLLNDKVGSVKTLNWKVLSESFNWQNSEPFLEENAKTLVKMNFGSLNLEVPAWELEPNGRLIEWFRLKKRQI